MMGNDGDSRSPMFIVADRVFGGNLRGEICRWREAGVSLRAIQRLLAAELGTKPALETVRRWVRIAESNGKTAA